MSASVLSSRDIIGEFFYRLEQDNGAGWVDKVAMLFNTTLGQEKYPWLGSSPAMREWIGARNSTGLGSNSVTIVNTPYEATLEVLVDELRRDQTGQVMVRIQELAERTNSHWAKLISELIIAGESNVCYDGSFFFDTTHVEQGNSTAQSNDVSCDISTYPASVHGSVTAPSAEEASQVILKGISQILSFKDNQNEPMNENARSFTVQCPISLLSACLAGTQSANFANGGQNVLAMSDFNVSVTGNARLGAWTDKLAVFRDDASTSAFIRQEEGGIEIEAVAEGSELAFNEKIHRYGVSANRGVGFGYWQRACLLTMV